MKNATRRGHRTGSASIGAGLEALEGRQFCSATHHPAARHHHHHHAAAIVQPAVHATGVKRDIVIAQDDPFIGDYFGSIYLGEGQKKLVHIVVQSTDGQGNYFGTFGVADSDGEVVPPIVDRRVQFRIDAAGQFSMISIGHDQIITLTGEATDGTIQVAYHEFNVGGTVQNSLYASNSQQLG